MKKIITVTSFVLASAIGSGNAQASDGFLYRCYSQVLGTFQIAFDKSGRASCTLDYLTHKEPVDFYALERDENFEDENGVELYTSKSREGTMEIFMDPVLPRGGAKLKSAKTGGYVSIRMKYRIGMKLPQNNSALCIRQ